MQNETRTGYANIPLRWVGPLKIAYPEVELLEVPLATLETPLWPSVSRGAKLSRLTSGINITVVKECMTRSILLEAPAASYGCEVVNSLSKQFPKLQRLITKISRYTKLADYNTQLVGKLLFIRFSFEVGDAAGHNMATKAAESLANSLLEQYSELRYVSISGNYCTDKKVSAVNGILGRGKYVVAELELSRQLCREVLKTTPEKIVELNVKKNLIGTNIAGGLRTANAHFANMLLAFYLATGQDGANIVEGSQGIVHTELHADDLYFSVTLPNIIIGAVGAGKNLPYVEENLQRLGCLEKRKIGANARRLAAIAAAVVLCGEISLLAALTNQGELMRAHVTMERINTK